MTKQQAIELTLMRIRHESNVLAVSLKVLEGSLNEFYASLKTDDDNSYPLRPNIFSFNERLKRTVNYPYLASGAALRSPHRYASTAGASCYICRPPRSHRLASVQRSWRSAALGGLRRRFAR